MHLGTLDRTPPPFFRQGPSALTRLVFFSSLALFLMAADTRLNMTQPLRAAAATLLHPFERALHAPVTAAQSGGDYLEGLHAARAAEARTRAALTEQSQRVAQVELLEQENTRLRALLALNPRPGMRSLAAEVLYDAADPFTRKVVIDRGQTQGVQRGSPVINEKGVIGQVTRVYPLISEVTLLIDREAAIPVINTRTQQRSVAFGDATGTAMELRFLAGNADVQTGDLLTTSGLDGVYPSGLQVARVARVDRRADSAFAKIALDPMASSDNVRHVLVIEPVAAQLPPRPEAGATAAPAASGAAPAPARPRTRAGR
jgi:rod shape-determining protein MreC